MSKLKDHNPENPKSENLHIRISPEDKKILVEYADLEGITLSRFIMNLVRKLLITQNISNHSARYMNL